MAFTYVNYQFGDLGAVSSDPSIAIDIGTRTNGLLIVGVLWYLQADLIGVSYDSVSMTGFGEVESASSVYLETFYLENPSNGSNNLVINFVGDNNQLVRYCAFWFDGADQTTQPDYSGATDRLGTGDPTLSLTTNNNGSLMVAMECNEINEDPAIGSNGTEVYSYYATGRGQGWSYIVQPTAGSTTLDWNLTAETDWWAMSGGALNEAAAAEAIVGPFPTFIHT